MEDRHTPSAHPVRDTFDEIVRRYQDMVYGYAYARLGDAEAASDAAQEAFLAAWQALPSLRAPHALPAWLKRITLSACCRAARRPRIPTVPLNAIAELPSIHDPFTITAARERQALIDQAIRALPERERDAVVLFYINESSRAEIAAFLGVSELAIKKRLASARRRLEKGLRTMMQDEIQGQRPSRDTDFQERIRKFTQDFSQQINGGASIVRSLTALAQERTGEFQAAIQDINRQIQDGNLMSEAMKRYPQFFGDAYVDSVRLGEITGTLDIQLELMTKGLPLDQYASLTPDSPTISGMAEWLFLSAVRQSAHEIVVTPDAAWLEQDSETVGRWPGLLEYQDPNLTRPLLARFQRLAREYGDEYRRIDSRHVPQISAKFIASENPPRVRVSLRDEVV